MSSNQDDDNILSRRELLAGLGAVGTVAVGNSVYNVGQTVRGILGPGERSEEELDESVKDSFQEQKDAFAGDVADEMEQRKEVYTGITGEDFKSIYETVRDDLEEEDYSHQAGSLHDAILKEDPMFQSYTNGETSDGEIESVDLRWGYDDTIDSKLRMEMEWNNDTDINRYDIQDSAAEAFVDAMEQTLEDGKVDEYESEEW